MWQNTPIANNKSATNDDPLDRGAKISLFGSAISTLGDALQTIGGAISIEEGRISDAQQQQALDKLQSQIDELKKDNTQTTTSPDIDKLNKLLEKLVEQLDKGYM
ncbi:hypothetical protein MKY34_10630 [Sporosarcina sp. FSL K6-1522]|uniref:hypothetical protein n=1 Tax=Sporosarcina sp. FSL K6-1522 TaxID=2921554 RepID=UPI003159DE28